MDGEIALHVVAAAPATVPDLLPARAHDDGACASRPGGPATRWSPTATAFPNPTSLRAPCSAAQAMALVVLPLVGFDARRPAAGHGGRLVRSQLRCSASRACPQPHRGWWARPSPCNRLDRLPPQAWDVALDAVCTETDTCLIRTRRPHEHAQTLLADEVRTRRLLDRRSRTRAAPNRGPACATTRRATSCASMQVGDGVLFYHSSSESRASTALPKSRPRPIRTRPSSTESRITSIRRSRARNRAGPWWTSASCASSSGRSRWTKSAACRCARRGFRADPARHPPVGAAGDGRAVEATLSLESAGVRMTEAKRLAGEKAIEYVEDGMIVGVGTGSTVAYFIDALARSSIASRAPCPAPNRARSGCVARHRGDGAQRHRPAVAVRGRRRRMRPAQVPDQGRRRRADAREDHRRGQRAVRLHHRPEQAGRCAGPVSAAGRSDPDGAQPGRARDRGA